MNVDMDTSNSTNGNVQEEEEEESKVTGNETFTVGISPQYWAYIPLNISSVLNLTLSDGGINILEHENNQIPVSKCVMVGFLVNKVIRSDLSCSYVLDDGTALIDCVSYAQVNNNFDLPSLFGEERKKKKKKKPVYQLGDWVRIFGKIICLARINKVSGGRPTKIIREIKIQAMEHVDLSSRHCHAETQHWITCASHLKYSSKACNTPKRCLEAMGTAIQMQVQKRQNLPSLEDTCGAYQVFGISCRCCLPYKESLLYCHCQAKITTLDPRFKFRDQVLQTLLDMERRTKSFESEMLYFQYQDIKSNKRLQTVAIKEIQEHHSSNNNNNMGKAPSQDQLKARVNFLFKATFGALRQDGILYLVERSSDKYLLISREKVLEPFVRKDMEITKNSADFISWENAPRHFVQERETRLLQSARLLYLKRCLRKKQKQK